MKFITHKYINIFIIAFVVILCVSCNEDKGNYSYTDINSVYISNIEDEYAYQLGEVTSIKPLLTFSEDPDADCTYEWLLLSNNDTKKPLVLATTKDLEIPVGGDIATLGTYIVSYRVTVKETGVQYIKIFKLTVASKLNLGFMVLNNVNNNLRLDMISYYDKQLYQNTDIIAATASNLPTNEKPIDIVTYFDYNSPVIGAGTAGYAIYILTEKDTYRIHPITFDYQENYNMNNIIVSTSGEKYVAEKIVSPLDNVGLMYANNNWHFYRRAVYTYYWGSPINVYKGEETLFKASPFMAANNNYTILFDEDTQSFVFQDNSDTYYLAKVMYVNLCEDTKATLFPYTKINEQNLELIYMNQRNARSSSSSIPAFAILKNTVTQTYHFASFVIANRTQNQYFEILGSEIANAKFYAWYPRKSSSTEEHPLFYFATEDKIYECDINQATGGKMQPRLVYTAPAGQKISMMEYLYTGTAAGIADWTYLMAVATYDPNDTLGEKGTLTFYQSARAAEGGGLSIAQNTMDTENPQNMSWTGFGQIVGVSYKYR